MRKFNLLLIITCLLSLVLTVSAYAGLTAYGQYLQSGGDPNSAEAQACFDHNGNQIKALPAGSTKSSSSTSTTSTSSTASTSAAKPGWQPGGTWNGNVYSGTCVNENGDVWIGTYNSTTGEFNGTWYSNPNNTQAAGNTQVTQEVRDGRVYQTAVTTQKSENIQTQTTVVTSWSVNAQPSTFRLDSTQVAKYKIDTGVNFYNSVTEYQYNEQGQLKKEIKKVQALNDDGTIAIHNCDTEYQYNNKGQLVDQQDIEYVAVVTVNEEGEIDHTFMETQTTRDYWHNALTGQVLIGSEVIVGNQYNQDGLVIRHTQIQTDFVYRRDGLSGPVELKSETSTAQVYLFKEPLAVNEDGSLTINNENVASVSSITSKKDYTDPTQPPVISEVSGSKNDLIDGTYSVLTPVDPEEADCTVVYFPNLKGDGVDYTWEISTQPVSNVNADADDGKEIKYGTQEWLDNLSASKQEKEKILLEWQKK